MDIVRLVLGTNQEALDEYIQSPSFSPIIVHMGTKMDVLVLLTHNNNTEAIKKILSIMEKNGTLPLYIDNCREAACRKLNENILAEVLSYRLSYNEYETILYAIESNFDHIPRIIDFLSKTITSKIVEPLGIESIFILVNLIILNNKTLIRHVCNVCPAFKNQLPLWRYIENIYDKKREKHIDPFLVDIQDAPAFISLPLHINGVREFNAFKIKLLNYMDVRCATISKTQDIFRLKIDI